MGSTYELVAKLGGGSAAYYDVISPSTSLDIVSPDSAVPTDRHYTAERGGGEPED